MDLLPAYLRTEAYSSSVRTYFIAARSAVRPPACCSCQLVSGANFWFLV